MARALDVLSDEARHGYELLHDSCGRIKTDDISPMVLRGDDRQEWLQGQATNDVRLLADGRALSFCLCSATGQIESVVDAWGSDDALFMTADPATASAVFRRVDQMVILEDVTIEDAASSFTLVSVQGARAEEGLLDLPGLDAGSLRCFRSDRTGCGGWDIWVPRAETSVLAKLERRFSPIDPSAVEVARLEAGIPVWGRDFTARTLPPELGPAFEAAHVSYKKGCYVGQEILMRIFSRGHTNRTWVGLLANEPLVAGAVVADKAGVVTSAAVSPNLGPIGGAMLRQEFVEAGTRVRVLVEGVEIEAEVRTMPLV